MAKILVADDNSNIQKMVGLALKDQGIDVVAVGNGEAAVRKISDIKPDLVLADVFMPVRNGYEVCRYVKEDATLSHIPVILLVGAFDPLDEQEAQRVGADGVLKKPFVPPDPLISMVKSALTRAGIPIGNEPPVEKVPEVPAARNAKDLLTPAVSSKLAALSAPPIPEAEAEPIEEFPAPPSAVKIAAGSEPVAFGNLLETPDSEDDAAFMPKPIEEMEAARNWGGGAESDEVAEEEEEEKPGLGGGWRPDGLDEVAEPAVPSRKAKTKDWREEAFHGNSPANISSGRRWTPATTTQVAEVAEVAEARNAGGGSFHPGEQAERSCGAICRGCMGGGTGKFGGRQDCGHDGSARSGEPGGRGSGAGTIGRGQGCGTGGDCTGTSNGTRELGRGKRISMGLGSEEGVAFGSYLGCAGSDGAANRRRGSTILAGRARAGGVHPRSIEHSSEHGNCGRARSSAD